MSNGMLVSHEACKYGNNELIHDSLFIIQACPCIFWINIDVDPEDALMTTKS
jgi:hypothetical protein